MFAEANTCLRRAIELDPNYAGPYAALGWLYILDFQNRWSNSPETSLDQAEGLIDEGIAKGDQDPFVHYVAAILYLWKKDYERWAHEADRAVSLIPTMGSHTSLEVWSTSIRENPPSRISSARSALTQLSSSTDISLARPIS